MLSEPFFNLSAVSSRQQGLVTAAQALRTGVGAATIDGLREERLLVELDWDVYQLAGDLLDPLYAYPYAAWLALAPETFAWERPKERAADAVLSHESASTLLGIGTVPALRMVFTVPDQREAIRASRLHVGGLAEEDILVRRGVPVTTPRRTIVDLLRDWVDHDAISRVIGDAVRHDLVDLQDVYRDLSALADEHVFPGDGPGFVTHFLPDVEIGRLSPRNLRAYARLAAPEQVAAVRERMAATLAEARTVTGSTASDAAEDELSWDLAAQAVGRLRWGG